MSSPWEILGVDPETADAETVRRAYVALVKKHRPDRDPEHFQEIRRAYEDAKKLLAHREETGAPLEELDTYEVDGTAVISRRWDPEQEYFPEHEEEEPAPATPGLVEEIRAALAEGDDATAIRLLVVARRDWERAPADHPWFPGLGAEAPALYLDAVGDEAAVRDAVIAAEHDAAELAEALIPLWIERRKSKAVAALGDLLAERPPQAAAFAPGVPLALVACAATLALPDPVRARRLADEAHQRLPLAYAEGVLHDADVMLRMAAELEELSLPDRRKLARVLAREGEELKGGDFLAVHNAMHAVSRQSITWEVLRTRYPDVARTTRKTQRVVDQYVRKRQRYDRWFSSSRVWVLVLLSVFVGRMMLRQLRSHRAAEQHQSVENERVWEYVDRPRRIEVGGSDIPAVYDQYPWLLQIRRDIASDWGYHPALAEHTLQGRGTIRRTGPRYRVMLQLFRNDTTLPESLRKRCEELLGALDAALPR